MRTGSRRQLLPLRPGCEKRKRAVDRKNLDIVLTKGLVVVGVLVGVVVSVTWLIYGAFPR